MSDLPPPTLALTDPHAVAANAGGALTPAQRDTLAAQMRRSRGLLIFFLVSAVLLVLIALPIWLGQEMSASPLALLIRLALLAVIALVLIVTVWTIARLRRIRGDVAGPAIASDDGQVTWNGSEYVAQVAARPLLPLRGAAMPPPGHYRFYYLAQSSWLLSADPIEPAEVTPAAMTTRLAQANGLLASALAANQAGRLADEQTRWLLRPLFGPALLVVAVTLAALALSALAAAAGQPWLILAVVLAALMIVIGDAVRLVRTARDVADRRALALDGDVERIVEGSRSRPRHFYALGDMRFRVTEAGYNALDEERRVRLYYVPHSERLVNVEVLGEARATLHDIGV
ncbi:MAG: hypothetical protein U0768_10420 [Anaerolineae bacterium]